MHWYYSREDTDLRTPSRASGIDHETEMRYRKEGARFIMDLGNKLGLRYLTMATGIVFFHRFYMIQSFKNFPRWVTGTACLFLAGKVEETPKKCKDVLRVAKGLLSNSHLECYGEDPREEVMMYERILLQTIKFDLQVDHPYQYLIKFGKGLKGDKEKLNEMVQKAWIFINDSLSTCICLHYQPPVVALAMLQLAARLANQNMQNFAPVPRQDWWRHFDPEVEQTHLDSICGEMMLMYEPGRKRTKSKDGSTASSPSLSITNSPNISMSPPSKKKRLISVSAIDGLKAKDSPLAKQPHVENVTPPNKSVVKDGSKTKSISSSAHLSSVHSSRPSTPSLLIPQISAIPQDQHNYYFQHGFKFAGINTKSGEIPQQQTQQQYQQPLLQLSTATLSAPAFTGSLLQYDSTLLSQAPLSTGYVDPTAFTYVTGQQTQSAPLIQQASQVATNWQTPQSGTGSGWMK